MSVSVCNSTFNYAWTILFYFLILFRTVIGFLMQGISWGKVKVPKKFESKKWVFHYCSTEFDKKKRFSAPQKTPSKSKYFCQKFRGKIQFLGGKVKIDLVAHFYYIQQLSSLHVSNSHISLQFNLVTGVIQLMTARILRIVYKIHIEVMGWIALVGVARAKIV